MAASDINGAPLFEGDNVIVLFGEVVEVGTDKVLLKLPDGHTIVAESDRLEKVTDGSISGEIAAAVGPASTTEATLVDADGNPLSTEYVNGKRVLATSGRVERLLSQIIELLIKIHEAELATH